MVDLLLLFFFFFVCWALIFLGLKGVGSLLGFAPSRTQGQRHGRVIDRLAPRRGISYFLLAVGLYFFFLTCAPFLIEESGQWVKVSFVAFSLLSFSSFALLARSLGNED